MTYRKTIIFSIFAIVSVSIGVIGMSAFEARVINVTARIENSLNVTPEEIIYGTVFPQEQHVREFTIALSRSFLDQGRVDTVDYAIEKKPKPRHGLSSFPGGIPGSEYCRKNQPADPGDPVDRYYAYCFPDLCDRLTMEAEGASSSSGSLTAKSSSESWTVILRTPCFEGMCDQGYDPGFYGLPFDSRLEHEVFGCDLLVEARSIRSISGHATSTFKTYRITSDNHQENSPAIHENHVVYSDWGGGATGVDLRIYDRTTKDDWPLVVRNGFQGNPDIWGNLAVWKAFDGDDYDIAGIEILSGNEFPVVAIDFSDQVDPAIWGNVVVWSDNRNGNYDIYAYDLSEKKESRITDDAYDNNKPRIFDNKIVWYTALGGGRYIVEGYDMDEGQRFAISSKANGFQVSPDIYQDRIVWVDFEAGDKIYFKDLSNGEEKIISGASDHASYPRISDNLAVWIEDGGIGAHDIYAYDFQADSIIQISDDGPQQSSPTIPDISGASAVWMSWHTGNGDIYGADLRT